MNLRKDHYRERRARPGDLRVVAGGPASRNVVSEVVAEGAVAAATGPGSGAADLAQPRRGRHA